MGADDETNDLLLLGSNCAVPCDGCVGFLLSWITGGAEMKPQTPQPVRKGTPPHLGRRTSAEREQYEAQNSIHAPRNLRTMLVAMPFPTSDVNVHVDDMMKTFKHWLMDLAHEARMSNNCDAQDTIERIIQKLN